MVCFLVVIAFVITEVVLDKAHVKLLLTLFDWLVWGANPNLLELHFFSAFFGDLCKDCSVL
ncbi:hypothetical protein EV13_1662 [Prochlorococcus sp. MIT 0702]|nr:hypothetical protein EV12_1571 [Prochlorococcus sp. MIT 0701]KGG28249.1 hypothetical protein EV13_1662 [Prochlorococcus sp. MIT 0702]KGG31465.1 hypothetical protein EV14_2257 [Prochlorococcus sp. MIT 0703]